MNADNFFYSVKKFSKEKNLVIAYYLYKICCNIEDYHILEEFQTIYNTLVVTLGLENHARKVVDAFIKKQIKDKYLSVARNTNENEKIFEYQGKIIDKYKEDCNIQESCGRWRSDNVDNINLIRAVFSGKEECFSKIIACTFFYEHEKGRKKFIIPDEIFIPKKIINASKKTSYVDFLIRAFKLSDDEGKILNIAYLSHTIKELYHVLNALLNQDIETRFSLYTKYTGLNIKTIKMSLRNDKKLVSYGIMNSDGDIEQDAIDCIYAKDLNIFFSDLFKKDETKNSYSLNSFSITKDETELAGRLLKNDCATSILLYGAPGAGKTEYAKSLVKKSGFTPLIFKNESEIDDDEASPTEHALCRLNCLLSLKKDDSVIIVDEAENMLSTRINFFDVMLGKSNNKKGIVNRMLENNVNKVIWILNYTETLDESTLRRFTYSIRFKEMSKNMLHDIAETKLNNISMSKELHNNLVDICGKYHVTGASVDNMVNTVKGMDLSHDNEKRVVNDVKKVLEANSTLLYGKSNMRDKVKESYDISVLNTSIPANEIVNMVMNAQSFSENNNIDETGIRMLFYGVSGSGKTELARYISQKLSKKILLKRASDILGMYVGENEQNIKAAFEEAEENDNVLLFDEADSFFADRNSAKNSWEITTVNEFLTQMEEFKGVLICTTNLRQIMDPAMQRRFHIITEFKPLTRIGIEKLLNRFFNSYKFEQSEISKIVNYDTATPGDFATLASKIRFMPSKKISTSTIVSELCKEQEEKINNGGRRIGFAS